MTVKLLIQSYFTAFNQQDWATMARLVSDDIEHHVNQGEVRSGIAAFEAFQTEMDRAYSEEAKDLVIFTSDDPTRAAAEFTIHGIYRATQDGLPPAQNQRYTLPVGSFFTIKENKITRVTTYYNLSDWLAQVSK